MCDYSISVYSANILLLNLCFMCNLKTREHHLNQVFEDIGEPVTTHIYLRMNINKIRSQLRHCDRYITCVTVIMLIEATHMYAMRTYFLFCDIVFASTLL